MLGGCVLQSIWCIRHAAYYFSHYQRVKNGFNKMHEIIYQCKFLPFPTWHHGLQLASSTRQTREIFPIVRYILHAPAPHISSCDCDHISLSFASIGDTGHRWGSHLALTSRSDATGEPMWRLRSLRMNDRKSGAYGP